MSVWRSQIPEIAAGMMPKAQAAVDKAAADIEAHAKQRAPVDTGALRNSIQSRPVAPLSAEVTTGVDYAIYQEYGTHKMAAQPFMTPAADAVSPLFVAAMAQIVSV